MYCYVAGIVAGHANSSNDFFVTVERNAATMTTPSTAAAMDIDDNNGSSIKRPYENVALEADDSSFRKRSKEELDNVEVASPRGAVTMNGSAPSASSMAAVGQNEFTFTSTKPFTSESIIPSSDAAVASLPPAVTGVLEQPISSLTESNNDAVPSSVTNDNVADESGATPDSQVPDVLTSTVTAYEEVTITTTSNKKPSSSSSSSWCGGSVLLLLLVTILVWFHVILGGIYLFPQEDHKLQLEHVNRQLEQLQQELSEKGAQLELTEQELERWKETAAALEVHKQGLQAQCREQMDAVLSRNRNEQQ